MHSIFLRYLNEVARHRSIRKAATALNVSSTSVNRKIISVEEQLGIRLFERSSEGVQLTTAGKVVLEHCRKTLFDFERVKTIVDDIRDLRKGHLRIETLDSVTFGILPKVLEQFGERYPGISLSVRTAQPDRIIGDIVEDKADIGFSFTNDTPNDVRVFSEKPAPFGIIMRPDHPLSERTSVTIDDLIGYQFVRTIDARSGDSILDQQIETLARSLTTHIFTNALFVAKQAILTSQVVGIYTKIGFMQEIERGELKYVKLINPSLSEYKIGLIVSATASIDPTKREFFSIVEQTLKQVSFDS